MSKYFPSLYYCNNNFFVSIICSFLKKSTHMNNPYSSDIKEIAQQFRILDIYWEDNPLRHLISLMKLGVLHTHIRGTSMRLLHYWLYAFFLEAQKEGFPKGSGALSQVGDFGRPQDPPKLALRAPWIFGMLRPTPRWAPRANHQIQVHGVMFNLERMLKKDNQTTAYSSVEIHHASRLPGSDVIEILSSPS